MVGLGLDYLGFIGQPEKIDGINLAIVAASGVMAGLFGRYSGALQFGFISYLMAKLVYEPIFTHKAGLDSIESVATAAFIPFLASLALKYIAKR